MTEEEKKEIIQVLQKQTSWHQLDVQKMIIFGILAFLAQFVFNQFAGDGQKMSDMLLAQEAMKQELKGMAREIATLRGSTEKRYRSDDAEKDIGILQRQIDVLNTEIYDRGKWMGEARQQIRDLERQVNSLINQKENGNSSTTFPPRSVP